MKEDSESSISWADWRRLILFYVVVFLDVACYGLMFPFFPILIKEYGASGFGLGALQGQTLLITGSFSIAAMVGSVIWGRLSDTWGRKPFFLLGLAFLTAGNLTMAFAGNIWLLCFARAVAGFGGGTESTANAGVADLVPAHLRSKYIGFLGGWAGAGFVLGPALGGFLAAFPFTYTAYAAAAVTGVCWLLVFFLMPETLATARPLGLPCFKSRAPKFGLQEELTPLSDSSSSASSDQGLLDKYKQGSSNETDRNRSTEHEAREPANNSANPTAEETNPDNPASQPQTLSLPARLSLHLVQYSTVLRGESILWKALVANFLLVMSDLVWETCWPLLAPEKYNLSGVGLGLVFAGLGLAFSLFVSVAGVLATKFGERRVALIGIGLGIPVIALVPVFGPSHSFSSNGYSSSHSNSNSNYSNPVAPEVAISIVLLAINVSLMATAAPTLPAIVSVVAGNNQGMTMGLLAAGTNLARSFGPPLMGTLYDLDPSRNLPFFASAALRILPFVLLLLVSGSRLAAKKRLLAAPTEV